MLNDTIKPFPSIFHIAIWLYFICLGHSSAYAQTYQWIDKQGVTQFTEYEPSEDQVYSGSAKKQKVNPNQISEKEDYLNKRDILEEQISGTINDVRRDQLKRQLLNLDYNWYAKYDPVKAEELKKQMDAPKIRVVPKDNQSNKMDRMKAFY
jgi:hypothetical protein